MSIFNRFMNHWEKFANAESAESAAGYFGNMVQMVEQKEHPKLPKFGEFARAVWTTIRNKKFMTEKQAKVIARELSMVEKDQSAQQVV